MYIVASTWEYIGDREKAEAGGRAMRSILINTPGVESIQHFVTEGAEAMVIVGYKDEATYRSIVDDPNGVFATNLARLGLEDLMRWKQSWRGEALDE